MRNMTLLIDPGHGGEDPGAISPWGPREKDISLIIGNGLRDALQWLGWPLNVYTTRKADETLTLSERGEIAEQVGADLIFALHCDSTPGGQGIITFFWPGNRYVELVARTVSRSAPAGVHRYTRLPVKASVDSGYPPGVRNVLSYSPVSTLLVEMGFLTHEGDTSTLRSVRGQREMVACLLCGVARALSLWEPPQES